MDEAKKIIFEIPLSMVVTIVTALSTVIVTLAIYIASLRKSEKREAKENLSLVSNLLVKNTESNLALSSSIDKSQTNNERIAERTERLLMSAIEKITELKNGKH